MKNGTKTLLIVIAVILVAAIGLYQFFGGNYNKMVSMDEQVNSSWAQVQNQYQRRLDLIPNLVNTVKGYAKHEESVFTEIAEARSKAGGQVNIDKSVLDDPEAFAKYQQVQNQLGASLQRLLVVSENYPELKADQNFLALQDELEGTENRIATERKRFNDVAQTYNTFIRQFPRNIVANMNGFRAKQYFAAADEAQKAPAVKFD